MKKPAILIAGTGSGCGKTTLTLGIMAALKARDMKVQPFKCGPDFIDPTLHHMVTGSLSPNLDIKMCGREYVRYLFGSKAPSGSDAISVIEGVMGLFDGEKGSGAELASLLNIPVVLVVNIASAAQSAAAVVKGFEEFEKKVNVAAVILNRAAGSRHADIVTRAIKSRCRAKVAGILPRVAEITIPSRHLGLSMGHESPLDQGQIDRLSKLVSEHIDLELILSLSQEHAAEAGSFSDPLEELSARHRKSVPVQIGIAKDRAFCFYYQDNLDMLRACGAELVELSPLEDKALPEGLDGLYIGGGYPELHAEALSENSRMRDDIASFSKCGRPLFAECGGFMYLTRSITDSEGNSWPMTGVFPFRSYMQKRLKSLGYRTPLIEEKCILGKAGGMLYGHEFHYSYIEKNTENSNVTENIKKIFKIDSKRREGYLKGNTLAGYMHLHWGRTPWAPSAFSDACRNRT